MKRRIYGAEADVEILWDRHGIPHIFAASTADAYRGLGYAAASERLWQIHQSTAYSRCEAAALLGERFVAQDLLQKACNVDGCSAPLPDSPYDWIADAYLDGMNSVVDGLDEVPPEFARAGATPRRFTRQDIAARYRFTSWFQHKSWTEKMLLGRLMATHGVERFRGHALHFSERDEDNVRVLGEPLRALDLSAAGIIYPEAGDRVHLSGSNNWAVVGRHAESGRGMLATDPHQPHTIPNTFFFAHLHAPELDVFGIGFPGVPYFMMGRTPQLAWGLTTGFVDSYDVYVEQVEGNAVRTPDGWASLEERNVSVAVRGEDARDYALQSSRHGVLLESLTSALGLASAPQGQYRTALHWSLADVPTSAGALAGLPLARSAEAFGHALFEDDVCPLVNNIICVDREDDLRRFIATTLPARSGVTGSVPLVGWQAEQDFRRSTEAELTVEVAPPSGYALTANDDTMGDSGPYPIHGFPASSARADRIRQLLDEGGPFSVADFESMQLDLLDLRALEVCRQVLPFLQESTDPDAQLAAGLLQAWDGRATVESAAACLIYPFIDRNWHRGFMREVLEDPALDLIPVGAPGLNRFDVDHFLAEGSPWHAEAAQLKARVVAVMCSVVEGVRRSLGEDSTQWRWGDLHQIQFAHRLAGQDPWSDMRVGPKPIGGSATTLNMAMHMGPGPGRGAEDVVPCRVYHGPAYRLVVDLAEEDLVHLVIAGGNGGRVGSAHTTDQFDDWLDGRHRRVSLNREHIEVHEQWQLAAQEQAS